MNPKTEIDDAASREFEAIPLDPERKCRNCYESMFGMEMCSGYEMATTEDEEIDWAATCGRYEREEEYCPSSSAGDYSPSNPWDAPGMSVRDFI